MNVFQNIFLFMGIFIFLREEKNNNLTIYCQGATGLPFDKDTRGSVAFLTIGEKTKLGSYTI